MKKLISILALLLVCTTACAQSIARLEYADKMGFSPQDTSRCQLYFPVHNLESWQAGATDQPIDFYLDVTPPADVLGDSYLDEETLRGFTRIPIGIYLQDGETVCDLVVSEDGTLGVEMSEPHRLYEAGPGCEALVNLAEKVLGYRPGSMDFLDKTSVRATLQWQAGEMPHSGAGGVPRTWQEGSIVLENPELLRRLDETLSHADFSVGSVNCPSPCFLTVEYADGSSASMAVAVNSFRLFFCNGLYFTTREDIIDLFHLKETDFYRGYYGG